MPDETVAQPTTDAAPASESHSFFSLLTEAMAEGGEFATSKTDDAHKTTDTEQAVKPADDVPATAPEVTPPDESAASSEQAQVPDITDQTDPAPPSPDLEARIKSLEELLKSQGIDPAAPQEALAKQKEAIRAQAEAAAEQQIRETADTAARAEHWKALQETAISEMIEEGWSQSDAANFTEELTARVNDQWNTPLSVKLFNATLEKQIGNLKTERLNAVTERTAALEAIRNEFPHANTSLLEHAANQPNTKAENLRAIAEVTSKHVSAEVAQATKALSEENKTLKAQIDTLKADYAKAVDAGRRAALEEVDNARTTSHVEGKGVSTPTTHEYKPTGRFTEALLREFGTQRAV